MEEYAIRWAADLLFAALAKSGSSMKLSEATRSVGRPYFDMKLARVVLSLSPDRFVATDRRWAITVRSADAKQPMERAIEEILDATGTPMEAHSIAALVAAVHRRPVEAVDASVERLLKRSERFIEIDGHGYVRRCWLLDTSSDTPEDVLFDNFLEETDVAPYASISNSVAADDPARTASALNAAGTPVPCKILQYLAWRADPARFDPVRFMVGLLEGGAVLLSTRQWVGPALVEEMVGLLPDIAEREVADEVGVGVVEPSQPLTIADSERAQLVEYVLHAKATSHAAAMLEDIFEVSAGEPTYEADLTSVLDCLKADARVVWVGSDRFLPAGAVPDYVFSVPEHLGYPEHEYLDFEGNPVDVLLEDDGFSAALRQEIMSPLVQDVLDEEPSDAPAGDPPVTVRCVLPFHHKELGTFPLCQLPAGFFFADAPVVQAEVELPSGQVVSVWINNETRLLYGLIDWYHTVPADTGAVFYLERKAWDRYVLTWGEETEPAMFVSRNRINDLLELRQKAEAEELPTYEILRTIMEHYRKGIEFVTAVTEVGIVRRSRRRLLASLLSAYHCFYQRGNAWVYDVRRVSQGFDKSKRKYIVGR